MIFSEAVSLAKNSTRIALFSPPIFADCLRHCLDFHKVQYGFYSHESQNIFSTDFQIFQTEITDDFNTIKPNIAFIIPQRDSQFSQLNLGQMINGGVLIFNENLEEKISTTPGFFRKLSFENTEIKTENDQKFLETDFSHIPLHFEDPVLLENIFGIKILCQQMGIMEEDFYEALMEF